MTASRVDGVLAAPGYARGLEAVAGAPGRPRARARRGRRGRRRRPRRRRRDPVPDRRARDRQDPAPRGAPSPRSRTRQRPPSSGARCGSRAGASPTASRCRTGRSGTSCERGSASSRTSPSSGCGVALRRTLDGLFGARPLEIYPYLGAMLGLVARARGRARGWPSSRPRPCSTGRSRWSASCSRVWPQDGPVVGRRSRTCTGPTRPRSSCSSACWPTPRRPRLLLVLSHAARARPPVVAREGGARRASSRTGPARSRSRRCRATPTASCSTRSSAPDTLPADIERRILEPAEGNPFFLEELVAVARRRRGAGARRARGGGSTTRSPVEVPPTVEKVILARIDRLRPAAHDALTAASVLGPAVRPAAARGAWSGGDGRGAARRCSSCSGSTWSARAGGGPSPSTGSSTR